MKFSYSAVTNEGKRIEGVAEATDRQSLANTLVKQGARPLVIKAETGGKGLNFSISRNKVKLKDLVVFTRQLSTMISAGVSLSRSLSTLQQQTENQYFKKQLALVARDVESGISLADSLERAPDIFSPIYVNMVRAGEAGGILEDILKKLALQQEKDASIRKKIKAAATYPVILLLITIGAFFALTLFVIPQIGAMLKDIAGPDTPLPPLTLVMLAISDFIKNQWYIIVVATVGGTFGYRRWHKTPAGKAKVDQILLKIPVINTIITKVAVARFARIFSSLMAAGVSVLDSLQVTGRAIGNTVIEKELAEAAKAVKNGKPLSEPLSASAHFPPIVSQMLAVGEETGETETILLKVADFYEEEVDALVEGLSSIIEPIMIVVMGGMVGLVAASVLGPISSLTNNIEGSTLNVNYLLTLLRLWL